MGADEADRLYVLWAARRACRLLPAEHSVLTPLARLRLRSQSANRDMSRVGDGICLAIASIGVAIHGRFTILRNGEGKARRSGSRRRTSGHASTRTEGVYFTLFTQ